MCTWACHDVVSSGSLSLPSSTEMVAMLQETGLEGLD